MFNSIVVGRNSCRSDACIRHLAAGLQNVGFKNPTDMATWNFYKNR